MTKPGATAAKQVSIAESAQGLRDHELVAIADSIFDFEVGGATPAGKFDRRVRERNGLLPQLSTYD